MPIYIWGVIGILIFVVVVLGVMFWRTPHRFFGAMGKGTANAEVASLIDKLNHLEDKLKKGGAAIAGPFAGPKKGARFCEECGTKNEADATFCEECGERFEENE